MPRRALADKRPFLLLSIAAALAFYFLRVGNLPELYLLPVKGAAAGLLATYAFVRHAGKDAKLLGWALVAAALGDMGMELDRNIGALLIFLFHVLAMGLFLRHRREVLTPSQKLVAGLTLILTPVVGYLLPYDRALAIQTGLFALALGAMAASAWASSFPRYRVGVGAMLVLAANLLLFAEMGPLSGSRFPQVVHWPLYYLGLFMICTGVIQTLRHRDRDMGASGGR